jgi:hypothetical protein
MRTACRSPWLGAPLALAACAGQGGQGAKGDTALEYLAPAPAKALVLGGTSGCLLGGDGATCWPEPAPDGAVMTGVQGVALTHDSTAVLASGRLDCAGICPDPDEEFFPGSRWDRVAGRDGICGRRIDGVISYWDAGGFRSDVLAAPMVQLDMNGNTLCGIDEAGTIACWAARGDHLVGWSDEPPPTEGPYTRVAVGDYHGCALDASGELACWAGLTAMPTPPAGTYTDLACSFVQCCAVATGGALSCWGDEWQDEDVWPFTPPGGSDWVEVAVGTYNACALDGAGRVGCWGGCEHGECDVPAELARPEDTGG